MRSIWLKLVRLFRGSPHKRNELLILKDTLSGKYYLKAIVDDVEYYQNHLYCHDGSSFSCNFKKSVAEPRLYDFNKVIRLYNGVLIRYWQLFTPDRYENSQVVRSSLGVRKEVDTLKKEKEQTSLLLDELRACDPASPEEDKIWERLKEIGYIK